jgi:hypothetical protein
MRAPHVTLGLVAALVLTASACRKLDAPSPPQGPLKTVMVEAIPADMGDLIAVTTAPQWPSNAQLWFVKPDKSIAMVGVNMRTLHVSGTSVIIPRR